jgi:hypothetical protein
MNALGKFGIGLVLGVVLVSVAAAVAGGDPAASSETTDEAATSVPTTAFSEPWVEPGEVLVETTAILPRGLDVTDGIAVFEYDLAGLAPTLGVDDESGSPGDVVVFPERWELTTASGATVPAETSAQARLVRFELPSATDSVARIDLVGWRVATTVGDRIELPLEEGASGGLRSGEAVIETILDQRNSTIVQIDLIGGSDSHTNGVLRPLDARWRISGRQGGGLQLIWEGTDVPDEVVLEDVGFHFRLIQGRVEVVEGGAGQ